MSLKYAVLATLSHNEASGYDLAKAFAAQVSHFWHAMPQQVYGELGKLEKLGLVDAREVLQEGRPNKRVYSLNAAGRNALDQWLLEPTRPGAIKDEFLVKCLAMDLVPTDAFMRAFEERRRHATDRLAMYYPTLERMLRGRTEEEYFATARRVGSYITLKRGIAYEEENANWCDWALSLLAQRATRTE